MLGLEDFELHKHTRPPKCGMTIRPNSALCISGWDHWAFFRLFIQYRRTAAGMEGMGGVQKHSEAPGIEHGLLVLEMGITAGGVVVSLASRERMSSIKRGIVHMSILLLRG